MGAGDAGSGCPPVDRYRFGTLPGICFAEENDVVSAQAPGLSPLNQLRANDRTEQLAEKISFGGCAVDDPPQKEEPRC